MKLATKRRVVGYSVIALVVMTVAVPNHRHHRAVLRLNEIVNNLRLIDDGLDQHCMESSFNGHRLVTRADLTECPTGSQPYVAWPEGPVAGTYSTTTCDDLSTFDGGNHGALNRLQWEEICSHDPTSCGL